MRENQLTPVKGTGHDEDEITAHRHWSFSLKSSMVVLEQYSPCRKTRYLYFTDRDLSKSSIHFIKITELGEMEGVSSSAFLP